MSTFGIEVDGEVVSVGQFYTAMYWGFVVATSFVGISLVQGYLYFSRKNKDRTSMKVVVIALLILDPTSSILMAQTIYEYFVLNFGITANLAKVPVSWTVENELTVLETAIVQIFFASRVYLINNTVYTLPLGRTAPILVLVFALLAFVIGTLRTAFIGAWAVPSGEGGIFEMAVIVEESCALLSDILASACLCYMLHPPHLGSMKRPQAFKMLFVFMIHRAILMSLIEIGLIVTYASAKDFLYWMPFHQCKSKLYTNTLLAMLNSRSGGGFHARTPSRPPLDIPVLDLTIEENEGIVDATLTTTEGQNMEEVTTSGKGIQPER